MLRTAARVAGSGLEGSWLPRAVVAVLVAGVACVAAPQLAVAEGAGTVLDVGYAHSCAVKTDGTPVCWGRDEDGRSTPPSDIGTVGPGAPVSTSAPTITGTRQIGETLTAHNGTWDNDPIGYAYRWQRCSGSPTVCTTISGTADADDEDQTYTITEDDFAARLRVVVVATNEFGSTTSSASSRTSTIGSKPVATSRPTIAGTARTGTVLTADHGTWDNNPTGYSYRWQRCSGSPTVCTYITGTSDADDGDATYTVTGDDISNRLRVVVVARNPVGSRSSTSSLTATVGAATP